MRLVAGPVGSGKTAAVLDALRSALRSRREDFRLLVPTATMADHLQHQLAREGAILRRRTIQTLSAFVSEIVPDLRQAGSTTLYLLVEQAARRLRRPEFEHVFEMPGFHAAAARVIEEFASAGCESARLAACLPDAPLAEGFLEIYRAVERELARRALVLRGQRLAMAAARIDAQGLPGIREIWLDGFHALPHPELRLIAALSRRAAVTLTAEDEEIGAGFLQPESVERAAHPRPGPAIAIVRAPSIERECDEIARRILEQAAAGRPYREMAIVVRAAESYIPLLRSTLERFAIPARFYFDARLDRHPAVRLLAGAVDALLAGWDHEAVLAVLRLAPRLADSNALDRLDWAVRERIPAAGLDSFASLTDAPPLLRMLDDLRALDDWRTQSLPPAGWAARLSSLRRLFRPSLDDHPGHDAAFESRADAAALDAFDEALAAAAEALSGAGRDASDPPSSPGAPDACLPISLADFWRTVKSALRLTPLRVPDARRNVVQVLSAPEARQWVVPVVFVCGMVEKQFPQFHRQDPFFPDAARQRLNAAGIRLRTAAQFEREEHALFRAAVSRATILTILSYPEFDARGERNLPSLYLESFAIPPEPAIPVRPQRRRPAPFQPVAAIAAPALLEVLAARTRAVSPTALEAYLACPFQYFATRLLRLQTAPPRPADRLDFLTQGNIVHEVLAAWWQQGGDIADHFEAVFARAAAEKRIPAASYHTERLRNGMLDDLLAFARSSLWPRDGLSSRTEEKFEFELAPGLAVRGKIDRLDTRDGLTYVIDYKYSNAQNVKGRLEDENLLQAPLYLMAADRHFHLRPAGFFYAGVKGKVRYSGWGEAAFPDGSIAVQPIPEDWLARTAARTVQAVEEIRGGRVEPSPADLSKCRYCDARDVCRFEGWEAVAPAAGAEGA